MLSRAPKLASILFVAAAMAVPATADAACTRLGFSVNDYGKEGPTKDAQSLLDKYVAKWAAERGIKNYKIGKKDVSCELFLDFIVFDEHTCRAEASVCWEGKELPDGTGAAAPSKKAPPKAAPKSAEGKPKAQ